MLPQGYLIAPLYHYPSIRISSSLSTTVVPLWFPILTNIHPYPSMGHWRIQGGRKGNVRPPPPPPPSHQPPTIPLKIKNACTKCFKKIYSPRALIIVSENHNLFFCLVWVIYLLFISICGFCIGRYCLVGGFGSKIPHLKCQDYIRVLVTTLFPS